MLNKLLTTLFCCAMLSIPLAANSNSQINAVGNTLKITSQQVTQIGPQLVELGFTKQSQGARQAATLSNADNRTQANFGLIAVALFCFVMRANRGRV